MQETSPLSTIPNTETSPKGYRFTQNQQTILAWFTRNEPSLGELYEGAIRLLLEVQLPGYTRFVSHAVRDIRNRLPGVLAGVKGGKLLEYPDRVDSIAKMWSTQGIIVQGGVTTASQETALPEEEVSHVSIPVDIFKAVDELLSDHVEVSEKRREAAKRLFKAATDARVEDLGRLDPTIGNWLDVTEWFMKRAHDSGATDSTIDLNTLKRQFDRFETILNVLIGQFFSTTDALDEILRKANR